MKDGTVTPKENCGLSRVYLEPGRKLAQAVTGWLAGKVRILPSGARSLEHILVVVPTRQSARQLRLALAKAFEGQGVVPPGVVLPAHMVRPCEAALAAAFPSLALDGAAPGVASDAEVAAAIVKFFEMNRRAEWPVLFPGAGEEEGADAALGALSLADQFKEIWDALGTNGLVMADVAVNEAAREVLEAAPGEAERWADLADFEARFFAFLNDGFSLLHPSQVKKLGLSEPDLPGDGIEEIVLPALVDPVPAFCKVLDLIRVVRPEIAITALIHADAGEAGRFDEYGRPLWQGGVPPVIDIDDSDIILAKRSADLAASLAEAFPLVDSGFEPPALGLADESLFPEIEAAFIKRGVVDIYNPEKHKLSASSLGRLALNLYSLLTESPPPFALFAGLLRENDVATAICAKGDGKILRAELLSELVRYMSEYIPLVMPERISGEAYPALAFALSVAKGWCDIGAGKVIDGLVAVLGDIYAERMIGKGPGDKEFVAASSALSSVIGEMRSPVVGSLSERNSSALFGKLVSKATYQLEPESTDLLKTEGWLELAWSDADNIAVVGMSEGKVPDSIVGHAFLPDRLRAALGIASNAQRLVRDAYLFSELLASHDRGAVKVFVPLTNGAGDALRPSRLLFMCDHAKLPNRALRLFGECDAALPSPPRVMPENWVLDLAKDVRTPEAYSASLIDAYIKCPFTYYLKNVLGMKHDPVKIELGADDFGNFVHEVLRKFGESGECREITDEEEIAAKLESLVNECEAKYYPNPTATIRIQLDSVRSRIVAFAKYEAAHRSAGWRPEGCELNLGGTIMHDGRKIAIKGKIDRIDYNQETGAYCIIDYKTWDKIDGAEDKIFGKDVAYAEEKMKWPIITAGRKKRRWRTVQMAFYNLLFAANNPGKRVTAFKYAVLGVTAENSGFYQGMDNYTFSSEDALKNAEEMIHKAIDGIENHIFWPPAPGEEWRFDFAKLFIAGPEEDYAKCGIAALPIQN